MSRSLSNQREARYERCVVKQYKMSKVNREIVTLQLGHYSNHVGTHWWNIQESAFVYTPSEQAEPNEINNDILFREGQNLRGDVTYTPRLVAFDLKGSLSTLPQHGKLYNITEDADDVRWLNDVTLHQTTPGRKNEFLSDLEREEGMECMDDSGHDSAEKVESERDAAESERGAQAQQVFGTKLYDLDNSVDVWSDFLRLHLHPRSIHLLHQYHHNNSLEHFDVFGLGQQVFKDPNTHAEVEDRLHFFLEECDNLQGIHVLVDTQDAFSGLASSVVEELSDEHSSKGIFCFGLSPPVFPDSTLVHHNFRLINSVLGFDKLSSHSSALLPLSLSERLWRKPEPPVTFPNLQYKRDLSYHTAAILSAALDTMSLPYRLQEGSSLVTQMLDAMTPQGKKVLALHSAMPFPMGHQSNLVDTLLALADELPWRPLTPGCPGGQRPEAQSVVIRGIEPGRVKGQLSRELASSLRTCDTIDDVINLYLRDTLNSNVNAVCSVRLPCKVTTPFPHIFGSTVGRDGFLGQTERPPNVGVEEVPVMTSLQSTVSLGTMLEYLSSQVGRLDIKKYHKFLESGLEEDEFQESIQNVQTLAQCYETGSGDMV